MRFPLALVVSDAMIPSLQVPIFAPMTKKND